MEWLFQSLTGGITSPQSYFICLLAAFGCGVMVAFASGFRARISRSFVVSLILLPMIVHTVITMVNGNVGTGVAVMGPSLWSASARSPVRLGISWRSSLL